MECLEEVLDLGSSPEVRAREPNSSSFQRSSGSPKWFHPRILFGRLTIVNIKTSIGYFLSIRSAGQSKVILNGFNTLEKVDAKVTSQ